MLSGTRRSPRQNKLLSSNLALSFLAKPKHLLCSHWGERGAKIKEEEKEEKEERKEKVNMENK